MQGTSTQAPVVRSLHRPGDRPARRALSWRCRLLRPYLRRELPRWEAIYHHLVGNQPVERRWAGEPRRWSRGKLHGYEMELDLARASERLSYFVGRFYELATQLLLLDVLRPGDRVVDVGANVGELTLLASRLVGPGGRVDAFEPNPRCLQRLASAVARNGIRNVRLHGKGLAASPGELRLTVPKRNSGEGSFSLPRASDAGRHDGVEVFRVPVGVGDEELADDERPPAFLKIDVEGFEYDVLSGLQRTLLDHRPLVTTELIARHLERAGRSPSDVFELMDDLGYEGYVLHARRRRFGYGVSQSPLAWKRRHALTLRPADSDGEGPDVLWVPREGPVRGRLSSYL